MKKRIMTMGVTLCMVTALCASAEVYADTNSEPAYYPTWMQAGTVITYDEEGNSTIVQGGELSADEYESRDDIEMIGEDHSEDMLVCPDTKVEYDLHGFIQNIYYLVPGTTDEYQLANPVQVLKDSGIMDAGTTYTYPNTYTNYDTGKKQHCKLTRSANGKKITGTGRITYFTGTYGEAGTHKLVAYDCATKMYYDDVDAGTAITAKNTYAGKSQIYHKYDVGSLPNAILDIWYSSSVNPITDITTSGNVDNVYSGSISHNAPAVES